MSNSNKGFWTKNIGDEYNMLDYLNLHNFY